MDKVAFQRAHRVSEIGIGHGALVAFEPKQKPKGFGALLVPFAALGAIVGGGGRQGPVSAPPPVSPYWHPVGASGAFWATALMQPAFRAAYNASKETLTQAAAGKMVLWRTWSYQGMWYATSRMSTMMAPELYQFRPPAAGAGKAPKEGTAAPLGRAAPRTPEDGVGDIQSRIAPYLDDYGMLDADSFGYDLGIGTAPTLDLQRWAALPVTPSASSPNWRALSAAELSLLQAEIGWSDAVAQASSSGHVIFKFRHSWYRILPGQAGFQVLGGGSGSGGARYVAGISRRLQLLGATKTGFLTPTSDQWSANPPGTTVANAAIAMLTYFQNNGVPWEGTPTTVVGTFQSAYNAEAAVLGLGTSQALLDTDEKYGDNTHDALGSIISAGGSSASVPDVNTTAPSGGGGTTPTPTPTKAPSDYTIPIVVGAVVAGTGIIGGSWWLATQQAKKRRRLAHA